MNEYFEFLRLFLGTIIYRPYVYVFFVCYLILSVHQLGWKTTLTFLVSTYLIAYGCEYSSTRNGFPFGPYTYYDATRTRELWISNIPFWDSLSFVFLSYFSFVLASNVVKDPLSRLTPWLGGFLMMMLDVVIDPVALRGEKWFLGKIYDYPYSGFYFGVTAANFAGWFFVGYTSQWFFQRLAAILPWCKKSLEIKKGKTKTHPLFVWACFGVYAGVFLFNLGVTVYIQDYALAKSSFMVSVVTLSVLGLLLKLQGNSR